MDFVPKPDLRNLKLYSGLYLHYTVLLYDYTVYKIIPSSIIPSII